jgi:hypothetical protein
MDLKLVMDLSARLHVDMVYDMEKNSKVWKVVSKTIHLKLLPKWKPYVMLGYGGQQTFEGKVSITKP